MEGWDETYFGYAPYDCIKTIMDFHEKKFITLKDLQKNKTEQELGNLTEAGLAL